jgi:hypothetical protein
MIFMTNLTPEGIPSCLSAIAVWFWLPDYPETADWLSCDEAQLASQRLAYNGSKGSSASMTWAEARATLMDWRLYVHYLVHIHLSFLLQSRLLNLLRFTSPCPFPSPPSLCSHPPS